MRLAVPSLHYITALVAAKWSSVCKNTCFGIFSMVTNSARTYNRPVNPGRQVLLSIYYFCRNTMKWNMYSLLTIRCCIKLSILGLIVPPNSSQRLSAPNFRTTPDRANMSSRSRFIFRIILNF